MVWETMKLVEFNCTEKVIDITDVIEGSSETIEY